MPVTVRPASEADLSALTRLDLTYPTDRVLALDRLRQALSTTDLALVAEVDGEVAGLLILVVPEWTDAAEITDLAIDIAFRRLGAGRVLVEAAADWARGRGYRALWVEPRADNHAAISFYVSLGFRVSGFNDRLYSNADHEDGKPTVYMHLELR